MQGFRSLSIGNFLIYYYRRKTGVVQKCSSP